MPLLAVSANDIDAAGLPLEAELPPPWLEHELGDASLGPRPGAPPARVALRLSRSGDDIVVRGRVRAALTTSCARCMEPAAVDVDTELSLLLRPAAPAKPAAGKAAAGKAAAGKAAAGKAAAGKPAKTPKKDEEYEFSSAEADQDTYDGETVVLDPFVREAILLEVPNFPLCSEGCPGIRPAAEPVSAGGHEEHADPRLAPLGALRARLAERAEMGEQSPQKTKKKE